MKQFLSIAAVSFAVMTASFAQVAAPAVTNPLKPMAPPTVTAPAVTAPTVAKPAMPAVAKPAVVAPEAKPKKEASAGQMAARDRQKKCGAEWKEAKAAGKTGDQKWPQYWSACNKRLKGA
jgi:ubiquitin